MSTAGTQREGFALAAAIVALVVVGAIVTGGFFAATQEGHIATSTRYSDEALFVAEHGLNAVIGSWGLPRYEKITLHHSATVVDTLRIGTSLIGEATVDVRRLGDRFYYIASTGRVLRGGRSAGAERRIGMVVRTSTLDVKADRAIQALAGLVVGGNSKVSGEDVVNPSWPADSCPSNQGTKTGVVAQDTSIVDTDGSGEIVGDPPKLEDATMDSTAFTDFGDWDYDELAAKASKIIPGGSTINNTEPSYTESGACNVADQLNWGAPSNTDDACHFHFPIIHATGDLNLNSNSSGQGILLVDGNLSIRGGYEFSGIVIVKGKIETGAGNSKIYGTLLVQGENINDPSRIKDCDETTCTSYVEGNPIVHLSSCSIDRSIKYNSDLSRSFPIAEHSWFDLSAAGVVGSD